MSSHPKPQALEILLELEGLAKRYGSVEALKDLDVSVPWGSIGLLGPNGAGKSTLLKLLLGLLRPTRGRARVLGHDPTEQPLALRQRVGYMPENDCFIAKLDAVETCTYAARLCGLPPTEARERANTVLEFVGLGDKRYLKVDRYSTGQKQRVKLAQALAHDPDLLLLDEPTNGLDPQGREEMLTLIRQLPRQRGCSVILSSHLLPDVEAVCERVMVLADGQLLHEGPIAELKIAEDDYYEVRVKDRVDELGTLLRHAGCNVRTDGATLQVTVPPGEDADVIFRQAVAAQIQVRHLALRKPNLQDAFLSVLRNARTPADAVGSNAGAQP